MKTLLFLPVLMAGFFSAQAVNAAPQTHSSKEVQFSTDQVINNQSSVNQRNIHLASAFNGWLYAAYTINDTTNSKGGIYVSFSKDNGQSWKKFVTYQFNNSYYSMIDIVTGGNDTSHLNVFLAGVLRNTSSGATTIYADDFDGRNGNLLTGQVFSRALGTTLHVTDMALATDNLFPSPGSCPFGVGLLYAIQGGVKDSLCLAVSTNGGQTFGQRSCLAATDFSFRNVSLGYGRSPGVPDGSYYAAWELLQTPASKLGHIYTSHSITGTGLNWVTPICLDSLSPATNNMVRNPSVAIQQSNTSNDNNDLSAFVTFECAQAGNGSNMNVSGYVNSKAYFGTHWTFNQVTSGSANSLEPNAGFNPATNDFLITYYDSTNGRLPYAEQGFNFGGSGSWNPLSAQYNDLNTNLKAAYPRMAVSPTLQQAAFVWNSENAATGHGAGMFDAEFAGVATGISPASVSVNQIGRIYPNPASSDMQIPVLLAQSVPVEMTIYDLLGNIIRPLQIVSVSSDTRSISVNVSDLADGIYFCHLSAGNLSPTLRFVVHH
jgi:hypothetical protein